MVTATKRQLFGLVRWHTLTLPTGAEGRHGDVGGSGEGELGTGLLLFEEGDAVLLLLGTDEGET
jgi:hypothetical protein